MSKIEYLYPLDVVVSKVFGMFHIFHESNRFDSSEEPTRLVLLMLTMFKDGLIGVRSFNDHDSFDIFQEKLDFLSKGQHDIDLYQPVVQNMNHSLSKINRHTYSRICHLFSEIDGKFLKENFSEVFDDILYRTSQSQGRYAGESIQPVELTRLICSLAELAPNSKVYNPFAGLASFGVYLDNQSNYFGQEINQATWTLGALRIMAYNKSGTSRYVWEDSIDHWPEHFEKFDLIVANPPFGMRLGNEYRHAEPGFKSVDQFLLKKGVRSLKERGKLIALLPQGILFRGSHEQNLREYLVDNDLIDTIISLPGGLLPNTSIPLVIIVLNKSKKMPGKIRFVDAQKFVNATGQRRKVLNDQALNALIHDHKVDEDSLRIIDISQIQMGDYNLNVPRYFQKEILLTSDERLVKLKDILEHVNGQRGNLPEYGKLVRIRDLKDDKVDFQLSASNIEISELRRRDIHQINETCLLLAIRWRTLKPTYFDFEGTSIYKSQDILSFKVDETIADYGYVVNELHADYVQEQLESYRMGVTIPFIRRDDLLKVAIKLPSVQEQKAKVKGIFELSDKIKVLQDERNALAHGVSTKLFESVSTIKHSLGKPLLNIGSSLRNIEKALSRLNSDWEQVQLNERYDLTIKDSFDSMYSNLELIHSMLRNNESVLEVSNYELTEIDFLGFLKGYVNRIKSAERSNVNTKIDIHPDIKIQLKNKVLIQANAELLEIALNTIVENANMHAFTDHSKKYKLEFRVSLYVAPGVKKQTDDIIGRFDTYIKVEVANNGKAFPENYTLEKLIRKGSFAGETGNTGQGGFDLNEIIKYHNEGKSTLELITDDITTGYTTTYSLLLPLNR